LTGGIALAGSGAKAQTVVGRPSCRGADLNCQALGSFRPFLFQGAGVSFALQPLVYLILAPANPRRAYLNSARKFACFLQPGEVRARKGYALQTFQLMVDEVSTLFLLGSANLS